MDEVFVKINRRLHYLWRAIDHEREVLECYVSKRQNKDEALKHLKTRCPRGKMMRKHRTPKEIVTDKLRSCGAAYGGDSKSRFVRNWRLFKQLLRKFLPPIQTKRKGQA